MINKKEGVVITGDFCPINRLSKAIIKEGCESIFNDLLPVIRKKELSIVNLECPLTEENTLINKTGPLLKAPEKAAETLSRAGFNLVTLANNHIMDYSISGLMTTIRACNENGIDYVGAGENNNKARNIYFSSVDNHTVAVLNFAENEYSTTHDNNPGANPMDLINNYYDIVLAKEKADYVFVIVHCGHEMFDLPSPRIKKTFRFYADAGASIVLGHHPHCYSGYEIYKGIPLFYSLGNFLFDDSKNKKEIWNTGYAVEVSLKESLSFNILPYEQCSSIVGVKLMNEAGLESFHKNITRLNSIISDDNKLIAEFENYCNRVSKMYYSFLEPYTNRLTRILQDKKLFPSLLSNCKKKLYLNLTRCESHRDVIIKLLGSKH